MVVQKNWEAIIIRALVGVGESVRQRGNLALAARLFAATASADTNLPFSTIVDHNRIMAAMPTYLQDPVFAAAWQEGEKLSLDEAIALALAR